MTCSVLYGYQLRTELSRHVEQLIGMKEMFLMLAGEISYTRTPLREAFLQMAAQNKEPFSSFLKKAAEEMGCNEESIGNFWRALVEEETGNFLFSREELLLLEKAGENFGYLDGQMQLKNLELYIGQAEVFIQQAQGELKDRQRLSGCLSLVCGLFVIILLV